MKNETFNIGNVELKYFEPDPNTERRFELPLLKYFLDKFQGKENLIEVGAVSNHYYPTTHRIYDPTDKGAIFAFAEDLNYEGKSVVSISTVEHISRPEYGLPATSPHRATVALCKMMEADNYLITWPIGYNTLVDKYARYIINTLYPSVITAARDAENNWAITNPKKFEFSYNTPYPCGNAVIIITNLGEFLTK